MIPPLDGPTSVADLTVTGEGIAPEALDVRRRFLILFSCYLAVVGIVAIPSIRASLEPQLVVLRYEFNWFLGWFPMPNAEIRYAQHIWGGLIHIALFSTLGIIFYRLAQHLWSRPDTFSMKEIACLSAVVTVFYFPILPYISCDVFLYIVKGWMDSALDVDPYIHGFGDIENISRHPMGANAHPSFRFILGNYGPLFQHWSRLLASLSGDNIQMALGLVKVGNAVALLMSGWLAARLAETVGVSGRYIFFVLVCNPLNQFCFISAAHNDILMMVPVVGGFLAMQKRQYLVAGGLLGLAFAIKYVPLLFLPACVIGIFAREPGMQRWRLALLFVAAFLIATALSFVGNPGAVQSFGSAAGAGYGYARSSIYLIFSMALGGNGAWFRLAAGFTLMGLLLLLWVLVLTRRVTYEPRSLFAWSAASMAYYILLLSQMVGEWYFIWLLPFTLISGQAAIRKASLLVACCLMPLAIFTCNGVLIPGLLTQVLTLLIYAPLLILTLGAVIPHFRKLAPADLESRV